VWSQELERLGHAGHRASRRADQRAERLERGQVERSVGLLEFMSVELLTITRASSP
jgi:hypothetical protein